MAASQTCGYPGMLNAVIASTIPAGDAADIRREDEPVVRPADAKSPALPTTAVVFAARLDAVLPTKERTTRCGHGWVAWGR